MKNLAFCLCFSSSQKPLNKQKTPKKMLLPFICAPPAPTWPKVATKITGKNSREFPPSFCPQKCRVFGNPPHHPTTPPNHTFRRKNFQETEKTISKVQEHIHIYIYIDTLPIPPYLFNYPNHPLPQKKPNHNHRSEPLPCLVLRLVVDPPPWYLGKDEGEPTKKTTKNRGENAQPSDGSKPQTTEPLTGTKGDTAAGKWLREKALEPKCNRKKAGAKRKQQP